jgi:hypothetical protein
MDTIPNHPRREDIAYLVKPELVRGTRRKPDDRVPNDHAIGVLIVHVLSLS